MTNTFWRDAAKGGLIIGGIVAVIAYLKAWLVASESGSGLGVLLSLLEAVAVGYFLYMMCRRRSMLSDVREGYPFGKNMSFVMAVMLFAGFIYGAAYYFLLNFAMPEFTEKMIGESLKASYMMYDSDMTDMMESMVRKVFASPLFWIFYGIMAMIIYGGIIGLIVSAIVKRKPDIFAGGQ